MDQRELRAATRLMPGAIIGLTFDQLRDRQRHVNLIEQRDGFFVVSLLSEQYFRKGDVIWADDHAFAVRRSRGS